MNKVLYKANVKSNFFIFIFITGMMLLYTTISVGMFDPDNAETINAMLNMMPEGMMKAFGFDGIGTELTSYISNYLYGFIFLVFPVIYTVIVSNKLIAKHVDTGSMAYLLTTPNSRKSIALTQAVFLASTSLAIILINTAVAIIMSSLMFSGMLDIGKFLMLNVVTYLCLFVIAGLGFFFSCLFNDTKNSLSFGTAIPVIFIVVKMVSAISENLDFLKFLSIYSLIDIDKILSDYGYSFSISGILMVVGLGLFYTSIQLFDRRSLSL